MNSEVVAAFTFLAESPDGGVVEVFEPISFSGTRSVHVRLHLGSRWVSLPRRGLGEIIEALQKAKAVSDEHYKKLVKKMNQERDDG